MSSAIKNSAYYAIGSVIKTASSFLLLPLFANILGAEQYGVFNALQTFSAILGTLMTKTLKSLRNVEWLKLLKN